MIFKPKIGNGTFHKIYLSKKKVIIVTKMLNNQNLKKINI